MIYNVKQAIVLVTINWLRLQKKTSALYRSLAINLFVFLIPEWHFEDR